MVRLIVTLMALILVLAPLSASADMETDDQSCTIGRGLESVKDPLGACTRLIESGSLSPTDLEAAYVSRGENYQNFYETSAAEQDFARATELDPYNNGPPAELATLYMMEGRYSEALPIFDRQIKGHEILLKEGFDPKALAESGAGDYSNRMLINYYLRRQDLTARDFQSARASNPDDLTVLARRCRGLAFLGDLKSALKDCDAVIDRDGADDKIVSYDVFVTRGIIKIRLGDLDGAASDFDNARWHTSWLPPEVVYGRGIVERMKGDVSGGEADMAHAVEVVV